ncbi:hypothetical protein ACH5RR_008959 [Cinchona calisaya]|uniref:RNase H type-1 domain-containing protein n=1 Tax=Cinchona calisaya TaxID=153742 RepID=A0ABD3AGN8_9GENT
MVSQVEELNGRLGNSGILYQCDLIDNGYEGFEFTSWDNHDGLVKAFSRSDEYEEVITNGWAKNRGDGLEGGFLEKLDNCKVGLVRWSKMSFRKIKHYAGILRKKIDQAQKSSICSDINRELKGWIKELEELLDKGKTIWKRQEKEQWNQGFVGRLGVSVGTGGPRISHLLFPDDILFLGRAVPEEAKMFKQILELYRAASGQQINHDKSVVFFSPNTSQPVRTQIMEIMVYYNVGFSKACGNIGSKRKCVLNEGFDKAIFEADALEIIKVIKDVEEDNSAVGVLVQEVRNNLLGLGNFEVEWTCKNNNSVAHSLARHAEVHKHMLIWQREILDFLEESLRADGCLI